MDGWMDGWMGATPGTKHNPVFLRADLTPLWADFDAD
jgi:hypothetical protein